MASSDLLSDPFSSFDTSSSQAPNGSSCLDRIGIGKSSVKWTAESHELFIAWWRGTEWFKTNDQKGENAIKIHWKGNRTSAHWTHFYQGARY